MAKISESDFLDMLADVAGGYASRPDYAELRERVLARMPEKAEAEGNKHIDKYITIKLQQTRRNLEEAKGVSATPELLPFLFPKGMPSGGGTRRDKSEVYDAFLSELGIETEDE